MVKCPGDPGLIPGSGRSPGEENGSPLQYSCLENPMDGGAWQATYSPWGHKGLETTERLQFHDFRGSVYRCVLICYCSHNKVSQTGWLNYRNSSSQTFVSWKFHIKEATGLLSGENSPLLANGSFLAVSPVLIPFLPVMRETSCVSSFSHKDTTSYAQGPHSHNHVLSELPPKGPVSKYSPISGL